MKMDFSIESMQDAVLARAALDGLLNQYAKGPVSSAVLAEAVQRQQPADPSPAKASQANADTNTIDFSRIPQNVAENAGSEQETDGAADSPTTGAFTKEQIKEAASKNAELAELVKGRGKKSAEKIAKINALTAQVLGVPVPTAEEPIGAALKGATAEELAAALGTKTTVVRQEPGVEVRVPTPTPTPSGNPIEGSLAEMLAARKAAAAGTATPASTPAAEQQGSEVASKTPDQMSKEELLNAIREYSDQGAGLFWFRSVIERSGAGDQAKMSVEYMREVLKNPGAFYPGAV